MEKTRECALQWVNDGKPCIYRYGFAWKGACHRSITTEKAKELIARPCWSFGMGFYELCWERHDNEQVLCFNEYSENDLL